MRFSTESDALRTLLEQDVGASASFDALERSITYLRVGGDPPQDSIGVRLTSTLILTNYHVTMDFRRRFGGHARFRDVPGRYAILDVLAEEPLADLGVLRVRPPTGEIASSGFAIARRPRYEVKQFVHMIGGFEEEPVEESGRITQPVMGPLKLHDHVNGGFLVEGMRGMFGTDIYAECGMSGSAYCNGRGMLIGNLSWNGRSGGSKIGAIRRLLHLTADRLERDR